MRCQGMPILIALMLAVGANARAQDTTFVLEATIPCCAAGEHVFGWLGSSQAGVDPADVPEPPAPPGIHLAAWFRIPGAPEPNRWRRDLRATTDFTSDGREIWDLRLSTNAAPATCTLTISPGEGETGDLQLVFTGAYEDTLTIPATISFPLAAESQLVIEVFSAGTASAATTWGAVKHTYE